MTHLWLNSAAGSHSPAYAIVSQIKFCYVRIWPLRQVTLSGLFSYYKAKAEGFQHKLYHYLLKRSKIICPSICSWCDQPPLRALLLGAGEMVRWLRAHTALPEDLSLVPSVHSGWFTNTSNSISRGSTPSSGLMCRCLRECVQAPPQQIHTITNR